MVKKKSNKTTVATRKARRVARNAARSDDASSASDASGVKKTADLSVVANQLNVPTEFAAAIMSKRPSVESAQQEAVPEAQPSDAAPSKQSAAKVVAPTNEGDIKPVDVPEGEDAQPAAVRLDNPIESAPQSEADVPNAVPQQEPEIVQGVGAANGVNNANKAGNSGSSGGGRGQKRKQQQGNVAPPPAPTPEPRSAPVAEGARFKFRHFMVLMSFLIMVVTPSAGIYWYLYERAADQYVSTIGFSVRKEEVGSAVDVFGSISQISSGSSSDTDILYEFIQSQEQVELVDKRLDLRSMYTKPENDPLFALPDGSSTEDLVVYWNRMVKIFYNGSNGLIQIRVHAFEPEDARDIAEAIFEESSLMINKLSAIARSDATRYAKDELDLAIERLKEARAAVTTFRNETQIVDPKADLQGQMGLINTLQVQLASAIIEQDLLLQTTKENDPRNAQAARKVEVIRNRIASERKKFGAGSGENAGAYSTLIARYEGLAVELEFAEQFYVTALQTYDGARAEAQRISRYLAAYVTPTLAQTPQYPKRLTIFGLVTFFAFLIWSIVVMVGYSVRSRR